MIWPAFSAVHIRSRIEALDCLLDLINCSIIKEQKGLNWLLTSQSPDWLACDQLWSRADPIDQIRGNGLHSIIMSEESIRSKWSIAWFSPNFCWWIIEPFAWPQVVIGQQQFSPQFPDVNIFTDYRRSQGSCWSALKTDLRSSYEGTFQETSPPS